MQKILKYFPDLTDLQKEQFHNILQLYPLWNEKINVISRKDIPNLEIHHVLHSLAIGRIRQFLKGEEILDIGTGGGFPGLPLAILFPESRFTLIDSIGKKIKVVENIAKEAGVHNIIPIHLNVKDINRKYDYIVTRAVKSLKQMDEWSKSCIMQDGSLICLKGGNISEEIEESGLEVNIFNIDKYFEESFFETKKIVVVNY